MAQIRRLHTLILGSGAAGLAAAVRLHAQGITDIAIYSEGLKTGTSINTGSDKQTYYKLGMYGNEPDSPVLMAKDLAAGGAVHGDIALVEASLSPETFHHLALLGVPFPHDLHGQHIGYKTDHDPKRRATSCGPYTSREMCRALIEEVKKRAIDVREKRVALKLLKLDDRCCGAVFLNLKVSQAQDALECVLADNVVFAVGGPGGFYAKSVYPSIHYGGIGLAVEIGAKTRNLAESQFGMASVKFRWNVSGSYMQVLPRFVSCAADGKSDEREFLREYFSGPAEMYDAIFLKGYQWPFAAGHVPGSSMIDIYVNREIVERGRRVFLDYRTDPADLDLNRLNEETRTYLKRSGATQNTPLARLIALNEPALELYRDHNIDLAAEMLEIAVCAQHNNGGLAGDIWWQSVNIPHLFPVGEVNGSHGVTRPGGSALNAGQAGAFRAAEIIAKKFASSDLDESAAAALAEKTLAEFRQLFTQKNTLSFKQERTLFQNRMTASGAFIRKKADVEQALEETRKQYKANAADGLAGLSCRDAAEALRNRHILAAQIVYLESIKRQIADGVGSRGGAIVQDNRGNIIPEDPRYRGFVLENSFSVKDTSVHSEWIPCRDVPDPDGWFETVWRDCRTGKIYE